MSGPVIDQIYRYPYPSELRSGADGARLCLAASERTGVTEGTGYSPFFFQGSLNHPRRSADLLLALSRVVQSRFHTPPAMLAKIIAEADPVVTCAPERIRFEGFSACCGVYARIDLEENALQGALLSPGTTNVDFNPSTRAALTRLKEGAPMSLSIGQGEIEMEVGDSTVVERKVPLPVRWLKGLLEVQTSQAAMEIKFEINGAETRRFLRTLPRGESGAAPAWVVASGPGLRVSRVETGKGVRVAGLERLRILEPIARHARAMRIYGSPAGASAWELLTPDSRFHLVLSPDVWRGFSGEGASLHRLADGSGAEHLEKVRAALRGQDRLEVAELAQETGISPHEVRGALARLATMGCVGFDLGQNAFFHRELPFNLDRLDRLQPRLLAARKLVENEAVRITSRTATCVEAWVRGTEVEHRVLLREADARCTCPWYGRHAGERGPCRHLLAVQLTLDPTDD